MLLSLEELGRGGGRIEFSKEKFPYGRSSQEKISEHRSQALKKGSCRGSRTGRFWQKTKLIIPIREVRSTSAERNLRPGGRSEAAGKSLRERLCP